MDKELLEKFNKINQKRQLYESTHGCPQVNQEPFSDDDEPASITSSIYSTERPAPNSLISVKSNSSLSHSSSNASSTSEPLAGKPKSSNNLKSQFINGSNRNSGLLRPTNGHLNGLNRSHLDSSQSINSQPASRSSQISLASQNDQMNSAKSTGSISDEAADSTRGSESAMDDRPKSELSISSDLNLNDSTIPAIDMSNLENLAKLSNQSDSNLSEPSDSNFSLPSDSNDTANEREDDREDEEELVVTNAITNIQQNPFMQQDKKTKLLFRAAREIRDSEETYVDVLSLICVQYKNAVRKSINQTTLDSLLQPFDTILQLNTVLLTRFNHCIKNWNRQPKIANVLVELGPFLKHYADFATKFEQININYSEIKRKYPAFREATETFERDPSCKNLTIGHCMLKPIQRIGQYKLLIEKYLKYLKSDRSHPDYENAIKALSTVTIAAEYTNEKMRENENFSKLLSIQQHITNGYEIIKPHRRLIKQNILHKISRKMKQERLFLLCSDCLIYLTIQKEGSYKVNHELSLIGMRISSPEQEAFQNEILIRSSQRSIRVVTSSLAEKEEWMEEINRQIQNNLRRRSTLQGEPESVSTSQYCIRSSMGPMCLGEEAPIWTPDSRVSMCQICTLDFSAFNRRHHCRACGKVVCSKCSRQQHYLIYAKRKQRVCDLCFELLTKYAIPEQDEEAPASNGQSLSGQRKLSSSDPTLDGRLESNETSNTQVSKKLRRNSSTVTSSARSSRNSSFFVEGQEHEQLNRERNEEILSSMLEETSSVENYDKNGVDNGIDTNGAEKNGTDKHRLDKSRSLIIGTEKLNGSRPNGVNKQSSIERSHSTVTQHPNEASYDRSTNGAKGRAERSTSLHDIEPPTPQPENFNRNKLRQSGRRRIPKVLTEISADEKESDISGYMLKRKGKKWRPFWFVLKQHVLYSFKQSEDVVAIASVCILGYSVRVSPVPVENQPANRILELTHQNLPTEHFKLESEQCVEKWLKALTAATSV